ncbi:beta-aspartyl-dipeptidase (metallo-type) [Lentibacillus halodurans]|uniref:Isoaspartyl dipeptidase n=1 Tax=Lentibacillus halodurans TaxID=237679 RepID=A0A1I0XN85_9BACI|nr:beta-aspartyl-peptidase [Lentibacillus halodurans]SFB02432.1 beta-aspartyl-dipeptidase (metallo-type) [Lentibacillus halodurans]
MITIIKNADIYAPKPVGQTSVLLINQKIAKIGNVDERAIERLGIEYKIIDAEGSIAVPGFIDPHVHLIGGGGEGGFATRTPEIQLSDIVKSGITTVVGLLGTDGTTRHMTSLLAKARGLEEEGMSAFIYTGNYAVPTTTITSNVKDDIILIDKIIGTGEIAISDSRSGQPSLHELAKLVAETRVGGMLSGKAGVTHFHTGPGKAYLSLLHQLLKDYDIPPSQLYATHITRSQELFDDAICLANKGGYVDITADDRTGEWITYYRKNGGNMQHLTLSSDGNGSLPKFNELGNLLGFDVASTQTLYQQVIAAVKDHGIPLEEVLPLVTANTATVLKMTNKGRIQESNDADVLILDKESLAIQHVFAKGRHMFKNEKLLVKGTFER